MASCLRVSPWLTRISARRGRIPSIPKILSSASLRLCGRIWLGGDGAFAPEAWVRSAIRPYHFFDSRGFASFAGLSETAEDCHFYNGFSLVAWRGVFVCRGGEGLVALRMLGFPAQAANAFPLWLLVFSGLAMWRPGLWICGRVE